jgi:hypothetical protein
MVQGLYNQLQMEIDKILDTYVEDYNKDHKDLLLPVQQSNMQSQMPPLTHLQS